MKVTKYPQSCLIVEKDGKRALIDPGSLVSAKFKALDLMPVDLILITHEHADHADPALIDDLTATKKIPVIANASTKKVFGDKITQVVEDGETISLAGFEITAKELPHCLMVNGDAGPQNTGFVIDKTFFHPGDGIEISGLKVDDAAVPIAGPDISPKDVHGFIMALGCKKIIPIHYDYFPAEPAFFKRLLAAETGLEVIILNNGETAEI